MGDVDVNFVDQIYQKGGKSNSNQSLERILTISGLNPSVSKSK